MSSIQQVHRHSPLFEAPIPTAAELEDPSAIRLVNQRRSELDTRNLKRPALKATKLEQKFRHGHWQATRDRIAFAMRSCTPPEKSIEQIDRQVDRFENCGAGCTTQWSEELQKRRLAGQYCKSRHCEPCARAKAARIRANLQKELADIGTNTHRFFTFTLRHTDAPLKEQIEKLYRSFKALRKTQVWRETQRGGCFMLEVKLVEPKNLVRADGTPSRPLEWHPHFHVVADGSWVSIEAIKNEWHRITGDSWCVDVRALPRSNDVAAYVTKYVTKGTSPEVWRHHEFAVEWIEASRGLRTCSTYGSWRGMKLTAPQESASDWVVEGNLHDLILQSRQGNQIAFDICMSLRPPAEIQEVLLTAE
jgi:hypothetical protein